MSTKNIFGLLIGIDQYPQNARLNGCVADSFDMEDYLRQAVPADKLHLVTLRNHEATKERITSAFLQHLSQAKEDDTVVLHYAGHGSREQADPAFWSVTPDRMNEVLVPVDAITPAMTMGNPLADKELKWLIKQIAKNNPHIAIVLDCCNSGDGSRLINSFKNRFTSARQDGIRSFEQYVFKDDTQLTQAFEQQKPIEFKSGKHILLAACRNTQTAKELKVNGSQRGIFTHSLTEALRNNSGNLSYKDLMRLASVKVLNTVQEQVPQLEAVIDSSQADMIFLGGNASKRKYYIVTKNPNSGVWEMDAGQINGITLAASEPTTFALFNQNTDLDADFPLAVAEAKVEQLELHRSVLNIADQSQLQATSYKALPTNIPSPKLKVRFEPETPSPRLYSAISLLRAVLYTAGQGGKPSAYVEEVYNNTEPDYRVISYMHNGKGKYKVCGPLDDRPLIEQTVGFGWREAMELVKQLEHIAQWEQINRLKNVASNIKPAEFEIEVLMSDRDRSNGNWSDFRKVPTDSGILDIRYYEFEEETTDESGRKVKEMHSSPEIKIRINNNSDRAYFASLYYLSSDFSATNELLQKRQIAAQQKGVAALEDNAITPQVPQELQNLGISQDKSVLKLLVSTDDFNADSYNLKGLQYAENMRSLVKSTRQTPAKDWQTFTLIINAIKSFDGNGRELLAKSGIQISLPNGFNANVAVSSHQQSESTRDLHRQSLPMIPDMLLADTDTSEVLPLIATRGTAPVLNVMELNNVQNAESITPDNPITISLPHSLEEGETILPFATDGEFYYPLGFAESNEDGSTTVTIERLVVEDPSNSERAVRGLFNTAKIVFHKLIGQKLGFGYEYPYLSFVSVDENGNSVYENNKLAVAEKVKQAARVLVIIHGFTGETKAFLQPERKKPVNPLLLDIQQHYDLVLAFDYDSYSTGIRQTALDFKKRLTDVGLGGGHGKTLHIMAHSMGGLVSRWMIEKEGASDMVQHLIMLGTPNNGSPWPKMKDWAAWAVTIGLSKITLVGWPLLALNYLMEGTKKAASLDKVTDDMKPGSELILSLDGSNDPGIPYTIIAGNTSILLKTQPDGEGKVKQILANLGIDKAHYQVLTQFLFREDNDIAASKSSMTNVSAARNPIPQLVIAPCDHISYFTTDAGRKVIEEWLKVSG